MKIALIQSPAVMGDIEKNFQWIKQAAILKFGKGGFDAIWICC